MAALRVLAIDGGGIRGIIPATILNALEQLTKCRTAQLFDLIVGTSTGGILALGLTKPGTTGGSAYSAEEAIALYSQKGTQIFPGGGPPKRGTGLFERSWQSSQRYGALFGGNPKYAGNARYFPSGLEQALKDELGETRMSQAVTDVVVMSYDLVMRQPLMFRSTDARASRGDPLDDPLMRDIARATSAAPTYFPPHPMNYAGVDRVLIDGGIFANGPSMIGFVEGCILARARGISTDDILLVSLGTGFRRAAPASLEYYKSRDWLSTALASISDALDGTRDNQHDLLTRLLKPTSPGQTYWRFQDELGTNVNEAMDDASPTNIAALQALAMRVVSENHANLVELGARLIAQ